MRAAKLSILTLLLVLLAGCGFKLHSGATLMSWSPMLAARRLVIFGIGTGQRGSRRWTPIC